MEYTNPDIARAAEILHSKLAGLESPERILRDEQLKALTEQLRSIPPEQRPQFGKELNRLKEELAFDTLREDSRFKDLMRRVGIPQ